MDFSVLGPLRIRDGDRTVEVGGCRQRAVLALLLLHANRVVPVGQLIDGVWGERLPASAGKNLQLYVSRLRKVLSAHEPPGRLQTVAPGYLIAVGDGELDTDRFQALARRARHLADTASTEVAAAAYHRALSLQHGATLADVAELPGIGPAARYWDERVLAVREEYLEWSLSTATGPDDLVGELQLLVGRHPHRERLRYLLMTALHRAGRATDALAVYAATRRSLADDFGLDPGPDLQRLHASILSGTGGARPSAATGPAHALEPPSDIPTFVGRERESALLEPFLTVPEAGAPPAVCLLEGPPGAGTSALAVHLAHRYAARFPGGRLYLDLSGPGGDRVPLTPAESLRRLLAALGVRPDRTPPDEAGRSALYRGLTAGTGRLVILDNAADGAQVRPLLPGHGCAVLITSARMVTDLNAAVRVPMGTLPPADAVALLRRLVGPVRSAADPDAVRSIVEHCGALPLALRQAGTLLAGRPGWSVGAVAERLGDPGARLDELSHGGDPLRTRFGAGYRALPGGGTGVAARLFRLIGTGADPAPTLTDVVRASGLPRAVVAGGLDGLVTAYLVENPQPGRFRMTALLRAFAAELADRYDGAAVSPADGGGVAPIYRADTGGRQSRVGPHQPA